MAIYTIFVYVVWFVAIYFTIVLLLLILSNRKQLYDSPVLDESKPLPKVSIVVPAYNEEKKIAESIESLKKVDYPQELLEIIVVNDGSTDRTAEVVSRYRGVPNLIFIDNKDNKGKAARLNQGISRARGEFVACMDADSQVQPDIIKKTVPYFRDPKTSAVNVTVKVNNPKGFMEKVIEIEYIIGLSLFLKALSFLNSVHVTPGPFSIYRKSVLKTIGGFDETSITEDLEIAHRLQRYDYKIASCLTTYVRTIIPERMRGLYRQRRRWYSGALITFWQYRDMAFRKKAGVFGVFLPYIYTVMVLGLILFLSSSYLGLTDTFHNLSLYAHANFNFFEHFSLKDIDPLSVSVFGVFGLSSIVSVFLLAFIGVKLTGQKIRSKAKGLMGFWLLFFIYQVFWISALFHVVFRREVKWR